VTVDTADVDRARALAATGHGEQAAEILDRILAGEPDHPGALLARAALHGEDREWDVALALLERAAAAAPRSAEALNALARCLHSLGRDDEALEHARAARDLLHEGDNFVQTAAVYLTLVWCLREKRRYREAIALAEEGLERMPDGVLAEWARQLEEDLAEAEKEEC
jgi:tetratricopeptide (TPR) repeat protein